MLFEMDKGARNGLYIPPVIKDDVSTHAQLGAMCALISDFPPGRKDNRCIASFMYTP